MDGTEQGSAVLHVKNIFRIGKERQQQTVSQSVSRCATISPFGVSFVGVRASSYYTDVASRMCAQQTSSSRRNSGIEATMFDCSVLNGWEGATKECFSLIALCCCSLICCLFWCRWELK